MDSFDEYEMILSDAVSQQARGICTEDDLDKMVGADGNRKKKPYVNTQIFVPNKKPADILADMIDKRRRRQPKKKRTRRRKRGPRCYAVHYDEN